MSPKQPPDLSRTIDLVRSFLLPALLGVSCSWPVAAAAAGLPPLVEPASQEHHAGKVILVELVTPDLAAAERFYGGLFGWTFRDIQTDGVTYANASLDGRSVAGLVHKDMPAGRQLQPVWLSFFAVRNVDAVRKTALEHGGKMLFAPHSIAGRGREAVFADPQGAVFGVLASSSGDPADDLAASGEWIWSSLITSDPEMGAAFYQALFDYDVFDLPADEGAEHLLLASDNYARASANSLPPNRPNAHPAWLNYVRVDNMAATVTRLVALGGRVLVEPRLDRHGGQIAVVADPLGAPFGLLEWLDTQSKEVTK